MEKSMLRIGLFGAGYAAQHHARALHRLSAMGLAQLVAIFSWELQRAEQLARRYGAQPCPDLTAFWEVNPDAVDICTPTSTHAEYALEAIRRGKHVLVEKPYCPNPAGSDRDAQRCSASRGDSDGRPRAAL